MVREALGVETPENEALSVEVVDTEGLREMSAVELLREETEGDKEAEKLEVRVRDDDTLPNKLPVPDTLELAHTVMEYVPEDVRKLDSLRVRDEVGDALGDSRDDWEILELLLNETEVVGLKEPTPREGVGLTPVAL